jgi:hypothetical protein
MLSLEEKLRLLSMVDILEPLSHEEIKELSRRIPDTHYQRGQLLYAPKERGEAKRGPGPRRTSAQQERDRAGALGRGCGLSPSRRRRLTRCCVAAAGSVL